MIMSRLIKSKFAAITLFLFTLVFFEPSAFAKTKFVIGTEDTKALPESEGDEDKYVAYFKDLLNDFAQSKDFEFEFKAYPNPRLLVSFLNGNIDFKCPDNREWAVDKKGSTKISYSDSLAEAVEGVLVQPKNLSRGLADFHTLGLRLGFTPVAFQELIHEGKVLVETNTLLSGLMMQAILGRIDGVYYNIDSANVVLEKMGKPGKLVFNPRLPSLRVAYSISSIKNEKVIAELNQYMKTHKAKIAELKKKHRLFEVDSQ